MKNGENSPPDDKKQEKTADGEPGNGENSPAWFQDDVDPAQLAKKQYFRIFNWTQIFKRNFAKECSCAGTVGPRFGNDLAPPGAQ